MGGSGNIPDCQTRFRYTRTELLSTSGRKGIEQNFSISANSLPGHQWGDQLAPSQQANSQGEPVNSMKEAKENYLVIISPQGSFLDAILWALLTENLYNMVISPLPVDGGRCAIIRGKSVGKNHRSISQEDRVGLRIDMESLRKLINPEQNFNSMFLHSHYITKAK